MHMLLRSSWSGELHRGPVPQSQHGDSLNLNQHALGQLVDGNACPGRLVREPLLVLAVHLCEVGHVGNEDLDRRYQLNGQ